MKTMVLILYVYTLSAAAAFMLYFAPENPEAGGIPEEAIRIRVIAHDNSRDEQNKKERVHQAVAGQINEWASSAGSIEEARLLIKENIPALKKIASETAGENVHVLFGTEAFPVKQYGRYLYPPNEYETLVMTIGDGDGDNWWCLLYPSFCFPEEQFEKDEKKPEYKWAVVELWGKWQN